MAVGRRDGTSSSWRTPGGDVSTMPCHAIAHEVCAAAPLQAGFEGTVVLFGLSRSVPTGELLTDVQQRICLVAPLRLTYMHSHGCACAGFRSCMLVLMCVSQLWWFSRSTVGSAGCGGTGSCVGVAAGGGLARALTATAGAAAWRPGQGPCVQGRGPAPLRAAGGLGGILLVYVFVVGACVGMEGCWVSGSGILCAM